MKFKRMIIALISMSCLWIAAIVGGQFAQPVLQAEANGGPKAGRMVIPDGYTGFIVAMANGVLPSNTDIVSTNLADFLDFQANALGRTPAEIAQHKADALQFFEDRFGVTAPENDPDYIFDTGVVLPQYNYRVYGIGGVKVPASGWLLEDASYRLIVVNPNGVTFGGEFAGVHAPFGTIAVFGDYKIVRLKKNGQPHPNPFIIAFKSTRAFTPAADGTGGFQCDLESPEFGIGLGQGFFWSIEGIPFPGMYQANQRTVMTFSDAPLNGL